MRDTIFGVKKSRDNLADVVRYYETNDETARSSRQQLEHLISMQVIAHYLGAPSKILEIGAGPGAYTIPLAEMGHSVTALDISKPLIEISQQRANAAGVSSSIRYIHADARDLSNRVSNDVFDAVLIMGPFYHLMKEHERSDVLKCAKDQLAPNGLILGTHLTRLGYLSTMILNSPETIATAELKEIWEEGHQKHHPRNGSFRGYFCHVEELVTFYEQGGTKIVGMHAQDPCISGNEFLFNRLPDALKMQWAHFLFQIGSHISAIASARHVMVAARASG